jgi:WD40 repeat protein
VPDIFISYAQKAPEPTQALAADLVSLKYSVWFDQRLLPVEKFGQVINNELDRAKAVITIWSEPALKSDWVYAEAMRASDAKKLINVHTPEIRPASLPVPFNISHVTPVSERIKICESLAKLNVHPGGAAPMEKAVREASEAALAFEYIKNSTDIEDFEAFLAEFSADGRQFYIRLAKKKITELQTRRGISAAPRAEIIEAPMPKEGDVFLRIEPGMHTAPIYRIGADASGSLIATGSHDKTARLWALGGNGKNTIQLLRTFRMPAGEGNEGKVSSVALSPDGKWLAAGGWDASWSIDGTMSVYIFEAASGRLARRLGGVNEVVFNLVFSKDGSQLAASLGGGRGVRVWETDGWQSIGKDEDYGGKPSFGCAFDVQGRLFTCADDGYIRRYGPNGKLQVKAATHSGKEPFSISVNAQGTKLAAGFRDAIAVDIYETGALNCLYSAPVEGIEGRLEAVSWSGDGSRLYGGKSSRGPFHIFIWQNEGKGSRSDKLLAQNTIMHLLPLGDAMAAGAADPAFGLIGPDGTKRVWQEGVIADLRDMKEKFRLSADAKTVTFGLKPFGEEPHRFDLPGFRLSSTASSGNDGLTSPRQSGINITDWYNSTAPKLNGKLLELSQYETAFCYAVAPDDSRFILGTHFSLRAYLKGGAELWKKSIPGIAWGVNISPNGKLAAVAYGDGTVRWHRMTDGQELLALFVHGKDPNRYIAWTPQGYYAASPGAEDLIGWHVNRGFETAPDFYPASTFASAFRRPEIVQAALNI